MPVDLHHGRVILERPRGIGLDEPVVVFRAQDAMLPNLLLEYGRLCHAAGSPPQHLVGIAKAQGVVNAWQAEHGAHLPGSKHPAQAVQNEPNSDGGQVVEFAPGVYANVWRLDSLRITEDRI